MEIYHKTPSFDDTYQTTYGTTLSTDRWKSGAIFKTSFTQSDPYTGLAAMQRRQAPSSLPKDRSAIALVHNPEHPCGIMTLPNVPTNTEGRFTNVRRDLYSDRQGLWCNAMFNTPGATINRGVGTYSNLHGSWSRIGPSTYDATHANGEWVNRWGCRTYLPSTARSLYDHRNVDPRDNLMPFETNPQNMPYTMPYY
jgi:hypothetical protein